MHGIKRELIFRVCAFGRAIDWIVPNAHRDRILSSRGYSPRVELCLRDCPRVGRVRTVQKVEVEVGVTVACRSPVLRVSPELFIHLKVRHLVELYLAIGLVTLDVSHHRDVHFVHLVNDPCPVLCQTFESVVSEHGSECDLGEV